MRISDNLNVIEGFFAGDLLNGVKLECGECKFIFDSFEKNNEPCFCPNCKNELFYRSYWEW